MEKFCSIKWLLAAGLAFSALTSPISGAGNEEGKFPPVPKEAFDNITDRLMVPYPDPVKAKAEEWKALSDEEIVARVKAEVAGAEKLSQRMSCEETANALAKIWRDRKDADAARKAAIIMTELASAMEAKAGVKLDFFNSGVAITPCVLAYALIDDSKAWDNLPGRSAGEGKGLVRKWFETSMLALVAALENAKSLHNMNPHAIQRGTGTALVLNRPDLIRQWILLTDRMCGPDCFTVDGMYSDHSTSYQTQVINHLKWAMANFEAFRDPPGYSDFKYRLKFDGTFKNSSRWPVHDRAKILTYDLLTWPDGRPIGLGDTHMFYKEAPRKPENWVDRECLELWSFGMYSLVGGKGMDRMEVIMNAKPNAEGIPYSWGHTHGDSLALDVWAAGGEQLPDQGYAAYIYGFGSGNSYFFRGPRQHNTVFAWDTKTSLGEYSRKWMRPNCLAYDDGTASAGTVKLMHLSCLGTVSENTKRRDRLVLMLSDGAKGHYFVDIAALCGGNRHESYLLQPEDEECSMNSDIELKPAGKTLEEVLLPKDYPKFGAYNFGHYGKWLECYRDPMRADGAKAFSFKFTGAGTGVNLTYFLNPVRGSQLLFSKAPQLRRRIIEGGPELTEVKKIPWDKYQGWHLTRSLEAAPDQTTIYAMVFDACAKDGSPVVESVKWPDVSDAANGQAIAVEVTGKDFIDIIYAGADQDVRKADGYMFSGSAVVIRFNRKTGSPVWTYSFGPGTVRDSGGNAFFTAKTEWNANVYGIERKSNGAENDALLVEGSLPPESVRGRWVNFRFEGDASGFGLKVKDFSQATVKDPKRGDVKVVRLLLDTDPDLSPFRVTGQGKQTVRFRNPEFQRFERK